MSKTTQLTDTATPCICCSFHVNCGSANTKASSSCRIVHSCGWSCLSHWTEKCESYKSHGANLDLMNVWASTACLRTLEAVRSACTGASYLSCCVWKTLICKSVHNYKTRIHLSISGRHCAALVYVPAMHVAMFSTSAGSHTGLGLVKALGHSLKVCRETAFMLKLLFKSAVCQYNV